MSTYVRNTLILIIVFVVALWAIYPPDKKLRKGKDIAGGISLVYHVEVGPNDPPDTLQKVASVVHERLDPAGVLEITVIPMGGNRLEITMPLPSVKVLKLKNTFEDSLKAAATSALTKDQLERVAMLDEPARTEQLKAFAGGDTDRLGKITAAAMDYATLTKARAEFESANANLKFIQEQIKAAGGETATGPVAEALKTKLKEAEEKAKALRVAAAGADSAYESSSKSVISAGLTTADLRRVFTLSDKPLRLPDKDNKIETIDSQRKSALDSILKQFPNQKDAVEKAKENWKIYEADRSGLDDPQDVVRILRGAGVLDFRITVQPGDTPNAIELQAQLKAGGPRAVKYDIEARFFRVNKIESWVQTKEDYEALKQSASAFFARRGLIAEEYKGAYYVMCWDKRGMRLTHAPEDGAWALTKSYAGQDQFGRAAIDFEMDVTGGEYLGRLTGNNVGRQMAVLLDDEVYTAPNLQSRITTRGQITGSFSQSEIDYIVRVLSAGSLKAKLNSEPESQSIVGPSLGADNLDKSFHTGVVAFSMVAAFMIVYYFTSGLIAVIALVFNCLLVVAMMALNQSAFSIPAIAGIVLTFGQAVDANVLIYERVREELHLGFDLRTSVRLGFSRALSPIVDGNVSNLIICVVLGFFGTEEIRGFAITLGIGVVTTLFSTLFFTRFIFNVLIEKFGWRHTSQLPIAVPFVQRMFSPHVDWMKHRWTLLGALVVFLGVSGWIAVSRGEDLLGMEFRAGTAVTLNFKTTGPAPKEGEPAPRMKMDRPEVERKVKHIGESAKPGSPLKSLAEAQVIAVNPDANNIRSDTFTIKSKVTDPGLIHDALVAEFQDSLDVLQGLSFEGSKATPDRAPAFPITSTDLGHSIEKPGKGGNVAEFRGGLAIVLDHLKPTVSRQELVERLAKERSKADFADTSQRHVEVRVLEGSEAAVSSAVVLVSDPDIRFEDRQRWTSDLRDREWKLATRALTESEALAGVQSFSPAIAKTFATQGFVCTLLSLLLLTVYVFVRFGTLRWAVAATVPLFADVIGIVGLLGLAQILYLSPSTQNWAAAVGLRPFDLDLAQIAAVLTIVGYSLNDKIIILDRIRENKGKLAYASKKVINDSINQTLSRTCITAGAHMITTIALYMFGGESVRGFAYTFNLGVLLGTYTSIVSTPLVWSAKSEPGTGGSGDARLSEYGTVPGASVNGDRASVDASRPAA